MRTPNILRDQIYRIVGDQNLDPAAKAAAIKNAGMTTAGGITAPTVQLPTSTAALPDAPSSPPQATGGAFSRAIAAQYAPTPPPLASGQAPAIPPPAGVPTAAFPDAAPPPTAAFANVTAPPTAAFPDATPPGLGDEIDRRRSLAVAALSNPTTLVNPTAPPTFPVRL